MSDISALKAKLTAVGIECAENEPMSEHTSFRIGGAAALFVVPYDEEQLEYVWRSVIESGLPRFVAGKGTNLLVRDEGFAGVVICLDGVCDEIECCGELLRCGAGASLTHVCRVAAANALSGMEFAYGIPGSVGGGVYMNAGAYGGELREIIDSVAFLDERGERRILPASELDMSYRHSVFSGRECCILQATFLLTPGAKEEIAAAMDDVMRRRKEKQPLDMPSAGSTFKRPEGAYASALIEQCGLKGRSVGGAQVSEKHSGFVVNRGGATAAEVLALVDIVKAEVKAKTGYELECEIKVI